VERRYTVFGGTGFLGGEIASLLEARGASVSRVTRANWPQPGTDLGRVIFTIGMTADFRKRLVETVEMQIVRAHEALSRYRFESFTYLSSARIYGSAESTSEDAELIARPTDPDHVYNLSKMAAESLCLAYGNPSIRVVRMSNVFGAQDVSNLFLTAVMREAVATGHVTIGQAPDSSKDYIHVRDAAEQIIAISELGQKQVYNVAAGQNVTHQMIADILVKCGYGVTFKAGGATVVIPTIDTSRFQEEFNRKPADPVQAIRQVIDTLKQSKGTP
jgi:nucleoside-diphosphate-sugar epimerase